MLFLLLIVFQEAFHQPFGECLTIGIHHQPTLIERILDITQLHKDGSGSGYGKVRISYAHLLCRKSPGWVDVYRTLTQTYFSYYSPIVCFLPFYSNNRKRHPFVFPYYGYQYE